MKRDSSLFLNDVFDNSKQILDFVNGMSYNDFANDNKTIYAVVRALEIIGEAVKHIPAHIKKNHADIEWKNIAGLRNILAHEYFGVNLPIIWATIENKIPALVLSMELIIKEYQVSSVKINFDD